MIRLPTDLRDQVVAFHMGGRCPFPIVQQSIDATNALTEQYDARYGDIEKEAFAFLATDYKEQIERRKALLQEIANSDMLLAARGQREHLQKIVGQLEGQCAKACCALDETGQKLKISLAAKQKVDHRLGTLLHRIGHEPPSTASLIASAVTQKACIYSAKKCNGTNEKSVYIPSKHKTGFFS